MKILFRIVLASVCCAPVLFGGTVNSAASGPWSSAAVWQSGTVPTSTDTVTILAGDTVTVDTNYTVAKVTVQGSAVILFDGKGNRELVSSGDIVVAAGGKIIPSAPFATGNAFNNLCIGGNLTVDGSIKDTVKGTTSGTRYVQQIIMESVLPMTKVSVQGTGTIGAGYLSINKNLSTDTVVIQPGITITTTYVYIYKGTLDNSKNNVSTYTASRFDDASVFLAKPIYIGAGQVSYLGNTSLTTGVELPDTIGSFFTQYSAKTVSLDKSIVVTNSLSLNDGRINTGKYTLKANGVVAHNGFQNKGFVIGSLEKPVTKASDTVKIFEVGSQKGYAEVTVRFVKLAPKGSLVVRTFETMHEKIVDTTLALKRHWTFTVKDSLAFGACDVTLRYTADDFGKNIHEGKEETSLIVGKYDPKVLWQFPNIGTRDTSGAGGTIQATGMEELNDLVIIKDQKALSVPSSSLSPSTFELLQNFPNPFNPTTTINYQLAVSDHVSLKVFDLVGREVAVVVNARQDAGTYSVNFDALQLSGGIYFYRLQSGNRSDVKKMILLK